MSAIWGFIPIEKEGIDKKLPSYLDGKTKMKQYKIDRVEEYREDGMNIGCGIQYFTKESVNEVLPIIEEEYIYTADCMLDNREEIMEMLEPRVYEKNCPDGRLIFDIYKEKREDCLNDLLGSYSFAFYDKKENVVELVSDIACTRCLYYRFESGVLEFSTTMEVLLERKKAPLNERWVVDFLALDNLAGMTECEETIYQGIYKVPPATMLKFSKKGMEKICYWHPDTSEDKGKSDEQYKAGMIQVFSKAVKSVLREGPKYMMLSGGLDSSSVVSFAAPVLKEKGEVMHTLTSIPEKECIAESSGYVNDESGKVKMTAKHFGNLECDFIKLEKVNPWAEHGKELKCLEIPYKSLQNLLWIKECMNRTKRDGGSIVLHGAYGNVTISFYSLEVMFNTWLKEKRFLHYVKECINFGKKNGIGRKQTIRAGLHMMKNYYGKPKQEEKQMSKEEIRKQLFGESFISDKMIEKYDLENRFRKIQKENTYHGMHMRKMAQLMKGDIQFSHNGEIDTKYSLETGVISRDPTLDKRVIEYCMRLPVDQFGNGKVQRRIVREYFKDIVPDHITQVEDVGVQSADMHLRFEDNWVEIKKDWERIYRENIDSSIVDCERALNDIERITKNPKDADQFDYLRLGYTAMMLEKIQEIGEINVTV